MTQIGGLYSIATALVVPAASPFTTYSQLLAHIKSNPNKVSYGHAQSTAQISGAIWSKAAKLEVIAVPYKATPQAMVDMYGGQVSAVFCELSVALPQIAAGKLRALAVVSPQRTALLPGVPTFVETLPDGPTIVGFSGLMMAAGTPKDIVDKLAAATKQVMDEPEFAEFLSKTMGADRLPYVTPAVFMDYLNKMEPLWKQGIQGAGIQAQ